MEIETLKELREKCIKLKNKMEEAYLRYALYDGKLKTEVDLEKYQKGFYLSNIVYLLVCILYAVLRGLIIIPNLIFFFPLTSFSLLFITFVRSRRLRKRQRKRIATKAQLYEEYQTVAEEYMKLVEQIKECLEELDDESKLAYEDLIKEYKIDIENIDNCNTTICTTSDLISYVTFNLLSMRVSNNNCDNMESLNNEVIVVDECKYENKDNHQRKLTVK